MLNALSPPATRRAALYAALITCLGHSPLARALARKTLEFPRDHGAHPDFRIEWWYLTGCLNTAAGAASHGFQVTFFRSRVPSTQHLRSPLAAKQLVFAHAAVTDVRSGKLWHDQRIARSSGLPPGANAVDVAATGTQTTSVVLKDWSLQRQGDRLQARASAENFDLHLDLQATQQLLLQGDQGLSRKGPQPDQASYYYSQPQLQVAGSVGVKGVQHTILTGSSAWLDHEWSQQMLHPSAVGWDWIGINLLDGGALTAFRLRTQDGAALWSGGSYRGQGASRSFNPGEVTFTAGRTWQSPLSRAIYPVEWTVQTPIGRFTVRAVIDPQELDSSSSTGAIYWEGLSELWDHDARLVGRGYLEMTGYAAPLRLNMDAP
jgi:predicted secreted hydrolase